MQTIGDITIGASEFGTGNVVIDQDEDRILVRREDIEGFAAAVRKHVTIIKDPEPTPHITAGGEDLRTTLMIARANLLVKKQDVAYEEGRISVLNSIIED